MLSSFNCSLLWNRFQTWHRMAWLQAGIVWKDGSQQFFGIFQTHKASLCGNECHISLRPQKVTVAMPISLSARKT